MLATAEATVMATKAGVDLTKLYEVITHATGDCVAVRTRLPAEGVVPESPASNNWAPGFMTDLMAKDLDLAIGYAAKAQTPLFICSRAPDVFERGKRGRPRAKTPRRWQRRSAGSPARRVLTLDLGTTATKGCALDDTGLVTLARSSIAPHHPQPGWVEQDAEAWWSSVLRACDEVRNAAPDAFGAVSAIGFAAARETFVLLDDSLTPIGPGILWSDQRGHADRHAR